MAGELLCREAMPEDRAFLLDLWGQAFGDGPAYAARCLDVFAGPGNVLVAQHGAVPISMLLMVPCSIGQALGVYLYALATKPGQRGAGAMSALMAYSEGLAARRGAAFSVLIPATTALVGYYQKRGYKHRLGLRHVRLPLEKDDPKAPLETQPLTGARLARLRAQCLCGPMLQFDAARSALVLEDVAGTEGAMLAVHKREEAYAVALCRKSTVVVAELAAHDDAAALALLNALAAQKGAPKHEARITLPLASPLFAGRGMVRNAALLKPLMPGFTFDAQTYLRFAMDEPFVFGRPRV